MESRHHHINAIVVLWNAVSRFCKYAAGSFIFCEASAFRKIGGFNNQLFATEELDLSTRLRSLARAAGKRAVILHHHPILTSDRKVRLYSSRELFRLIFRAAFTHRSAVRDREACHYWYDGRR